MNDLLHTPFKVGIAGRKHQTQNYENACIELGFVPCVSLSLSKLSTCDALILPGGFDITPGFYGQANHGSRNIDTELDLLQFHALEFFVRTKRPILGICKGMQLINVYFGGTLIQDLEHSELHQQAEGDLLHLSHVNTPCLLSELYGEDFQINSNHHQAVDKIGKDLVVVQTSEDGITEAFYHSTYPIWGVQWHPERLPLIEVSKNEKKTSVSGNLLIRAALTI